MIVVVFPIPDRRIKKPKSEIEGIVYIKFIKLKIGFEVILYSFMIIPIRPPIRKADIRDINKSLICCEIGFKKNRIFLLLYLKCCKTSLPPTLFELNYYEFTLKLSNKSR